MQIINCKISYIIGESQVYSTELKNNDYKIDIELKDDILYSKIQTSKEFKDFKIEFYLPIDKKFTQMITNGYQTWLPSYKINCNGKQNKLSAFLQKNMYKGSGIDCIAEYQSNFSKNTSFGMCYFKEDNTNNTLMFVSLDEKDTFTKYDYDFDRNVLKITRDFKGYAINKNMQLIKVLQIEKDFESSINVLKENLNLTDKTQKTTRLIAYNTFSDYKSNITAQIVNEKIHNLQNDYNMFIIGDGYAQNSGNILDIDEKKFPNGLKSIVENIHSKKILAALWITPFAISPLSKSFSDQQNLVIKQNAKPVVTCPFWGGAYSLDISLDDSTQYLKDMFDVIFNEYQFDAVYCDCTYMAASIPVAGKTQAMLINHAISTIRKLTENKLLILGGVPFLSAVGNCDWIAISSDSSNYWYDIGDILSANFPTSAKSSVNSLVYKKYLNKIYPCVYTVPNNKKIKNKLLQLISNASPNLIISDKQLKPTTFPSKFSLNNNE